MLITTCTNDSAIIQPGGLMVSPIGISAEVRKSVATSDPFPAISLSVVSIMNRAFCELIENKVSMTTPIKADTIAPLRTMVGKFLKR